MYAVSNEGPIERDRLKVVPARPAAARSGAPSELHLSRGQILFFEGDAAGHFFEMVRGTLRCCRIIQDGRRQIHRFAGAGELLGISGDQTYGYSAEAVTEIVVHRHRLDRLDQRMADDGAFGRRVLQALRDELAATRRQMMLLGRMSATERLATFLLELSDRSATAGGCLELPMTRGDIADYLGLTIETVSRKMNELHARGVIRLETATRVRIIDLDRIEAIAEAA